MDTTHWLTQYRGGFERVSPFGRKVLKAIERMAQAAGKEMK